MKINAGTLVVIVCVVITSSLLGYTFGQKGKNSASQNAAPQTQEGKSGQGGGNQAHGGFGGQNGSFGGQNTQTAVSVRTQVAEVKTLHDYVNTNGEIATQSSIEVFPDIGGKIVSVNVRLGSTVRRGDVIARIDPSTPGTQYANSSVYAPVSGVITKTPLKQGTTVSTASTITVIGDVENLQISASIPERYVAALKPGLKANITLEAYPNQIFTATVSQVSPLVDSTSRTKTVILNFDKKDSRINSGMFAKVTLFTLDYSGEITIPSDAIVEKNNKKYAYIVRSDNTAEQREITTGESVDGEIQVLSGINVGENVVIEGMRVLANGSLVNDISKNGSK